MILRNQVLLMAAKPKNILNNGVNYANWTVQGAGTTKGENGIHLVQEGINENAQFNINLKTSFPYTFCYRIIGGNANDFYMSLNSAFGASTSLPKTAGMKKVLLTTPEIITMNFLRLVIGTSTDGTYIDFTDVMLFEGDQTQNPNITGYIPYYS